jgi:TonB family protein
MKSGIVVAFSLAFALQAQAQTEAWSHINAGKTYDMAGECERAAAEYLAASNVKDLPADAKAEIDGYLNSITIQPLGNTADPAAALDPPEGARRPGNGVTVPELIQSPKPEYSPEARLAGLEGRVTLVAVVDASGEPQGVRIVQPLGLGLDAKAVEAVRNWRYKPGTFEGRPVAVFTGMTVWFTLPGKGSRWHLVQAAFDAGEGISRPRFAKADYPPGAGVSAAVIEEAQIIAAVRRFSGVTLAFDIDEHGFPVHMKVLTESSSQWGNEAIAVLRNWRFEPALRAGVAVSASGRVNLFWGAAILPPEALRYVHPGWDPESIGSGMCRDDVPIVESPPNPVYTEEALKAGLEGKVLVSLVVGPQGHPRDVHAVGTPLGMGLDERAVEAAAKWTFRPFNPGGRPYPVPALVEVDFHLPGTMMPKPPPPGVK